MRGHRHRQVGERPERREIARELLAAGRLDHRQLEMAVGAGAAMAGDVLDDRRDAAGDQPRHRGAARTSRPARRSRP